MSEKKITLFNKFYSSSKDKIYESLENSVDEFIKVSLPPRGAVDTMYKNWSSLISQIKEDEEASAYIIAHSYPKCITKRRNGEAVLHISAKNSAIASFFKNNKEILIDNINILFKKVVVNRIIVETK